MAHQILIVDDEISFAELFAEHLTSCGYTASVAVNAKLATQPGVVDFIAKPIQSLQELEGKIATYLKGP
jgi:DNA-binding NtrC family response regulator